MTHEKPLLGEYKVLHHIRVVPAQKMDSQGLYAALCVCGYRSSPNTFIEAHKAGQMHADAKNRNEEK